MIRSRAFYNIHGQRIQYELPPRPEELDHRQQCHSRQDRTDRFVKLPSQMSYTPCRFSLEAFLRTADDSRLQTKGPEVEEILH